MVVFPPPPGRRCHTCRHRLRPLRYWKLISFPPRTPTPMRRLLTFLLVSTIMATAQKTPAPASSPNAAPSADELNQMAARFAPVPLEVDLSGLSAGDKKALAKLIEAAR